VTGAVKTDTNKPKETTAKGKKWMTPWGSSYVRNKNGDFRKALGGIGSGAKESIRWAAAPTSHLAAHSRSRHVPKIKTLFLAEGLLFSLDRCLLNG
jgi:hypothetical protein